ncbi:MAG: exo-alpha-sialidase [Armatimonadetes bacterium]|nr:exo-alpha-sialidase [Armatimonadota bacterium]
MLGLVYIVCHMVLNEHKDWPDPDAYASVDSVDEDGLVVAIEGGASASCKYVMDVVSVKRATHLQILTEPFETPGAHDHAITMTGTTLEVNPSRRTRLTMLAAAIAVFQPAGWNTASAQRSIFGQLLAARIDGGELVLDRYDDASPEAVEGSATIAPGTSGASGVSLWAGRDGSLEAVYEANGAVRIAVSRDQGRTWGVPTTIASGYLNPVVGRDEPMGLHTVLMFKEADNTWYQSTEQPNGTWSSPVSTGLTGTNCAASLLPPTKGTARWEFVYTNADGDVVKVACDNPSVASAWTWE